VQAVTPEPPPELAEPAMSPERAAYLMRALTTLATVLIDSMVADLVAGSPGSTDGEASLSDRLMIRTLRPFLPKLRATFLDKLSGSDPAGIERLMGATSSTIETILGQAPGEPMPRFTWQWLPGEPRPTLVPFDPRP
jgi:hypothetical protein